jgi:ribonuclease VapC
LTVVVDTSALIAILLREPDNERLQNVLENGRALLAFGNRVELSLVFGGRVGTEAENRIGRLLDAYEIQVVPGDEAQLACAIEGSCRFGKGRGAEGSFLNYGDLFAYALAKARDLPLLYKGNDFVHTDVRPAV